jgi:type IV pilus assembly protein PilW
MNRRSRPARGFTLVELMVALAISMVIVLALITLLINVNRNNSELTRTNRLIENGRFALQLLDADMSHGGFWGGFVPKFDDLGVSGPSTDVPKGVPDPCLAYAAWDADYKTQLIGIPLQVYEIDNPVPSPTLSVCASKVVSPKAGTDVLFVRHADQSDPAAGGTDSCVLGAGGCPTANEVYFQYSNCNPVAPDTEPSGPVLSAGTAATFPLRKRACGTSLEPVRKLVSNMYYVRDYAVTAGDGIPTLMRANFSNSAFQSAQPLIEGIEGFRVELGIDNVSDNGSTLTTAVFDTDPASANAGQAATIVWANPKVLNSPTNRGDGNPDSYVRCTTGAPCSAFQLMNVVSAKVYVLARSLEKSAGHTDTKTYNLGGTTMGPFNDGYKRHLFTQTIRLTNVSMRRETP